MMCFYCSVIISYLYMYERTRREQTVDPKKKPEMIEKIVAAKVAKRLGELCLISQVNKLVTLVTLLLLLLLVK